MEPESSLPYSQVSATCPYPEPAPSSSHNPLPLPQDPSFNRLLLVPSYNFVITTPVVVLVITTKSVDTTETRRFYLLRANE
jgi:hypothetical protein